MRTTGSERVAPWLFLAPYIVLTAVFFMVPLVNAILLAFQQTNGPRATVWVGLENFQFILTDREFWKAVKNTTVYAVVSIFLQLPLALGLALLLNSRRDRMKGFFRLVLFCPNLVGQIFVGIIFGVLFMPRYGLINRFLHALTGQGLEHRWLSDPAMVMPAIILVSLWLYVGFNMIYFLAALQNVDGDLVDAARVDGAGPWREFLAVTLPAVKPVAVLVVIMSTIGSYQLFELPFALVGYGVNDSALTIVGYLYRNAFETGDLGTGAAVGWLLALIIFAVSLVHLKVAGAGRDGGDA